MYKVIPVVLVAGACIYYLLSGDSLTMSGGSDLCPGMVGEDFLKCYLGKHSRRFFEEHSFQKYSQPGSLSLFSMCKNRDVSKINALPQSTNVNHQDKQKNTALHVVASSFPFDKTTLDIVNVLKSRGAEVSLQNYWGVTAQYVFRMHVDKYYPVRTSEQTNFFNTIYLSLGTSEPVIIHKVQAPAQISVNAKKSTKAKAKRYSGRVLHAKAWDSSGPKRV